MLGSVFEYPQILEEPTADILALFREHQGAVMTWFLVLVVSAALMAPAGIWLGRLAGGTLGSGSPASASPPPPCRSSDCSAGSPSSPASAKTPSTRRSAPRAEDRFELWHTLLGKAIGETARLRPDRDLHRPRRRSRCAVRCCPAGWHSSGTPRPP